MSMSPQSTRVAFQYPNGTRKTTKTSARTRLWLQRRVPWVDQKHANRLLRDRPQNEKDQLYCVVKETRVIRRRGISRQKVVSSVSTISSGSAVIGADIMHQVRDNREYR